MENLEIIVNVLGIIFVIVAVLFLFCRIRYMLAFEKNQDVSIFSILFGILWIPLAIKNDDSDSLKKQKQRINLLLRLLFALFIVLVVCAVIFYVMK